MLLIKVTGIMLVESVVYYDNMHICNIINKYYLVIF